MFKLKGFSRPFRSPSVDLPRSPGPAQRPDSLPSSPRPPSRPSSAPPRLHTDQFTPQRPRTAPGSLPRSPTSPSSPRSPAAGPTQRPWQTPANIQQFSQNLETKYPGTKLTQYVGQQGHPDLQSNGGACNAITKEWIRLGSQSPSMDQASKVFGHNLDNNMPQLKAGQLQHQADAQDIKDAFQNLKQQRTVLDAEQARLEPLIEKYQRGELNPTEVQALNRDLRRFEKKSATFQRVSNDITEARMEERTKLGSGLPHMNVLEGAPIDNDSIGKLHNSLQKDGFHVIHLNKTSGGDGHVMAFQKQNGQYKFMDPNTGEFQTKDPKQATNILLDHLDNAYSKFDLITVDHFNG
ncbi:virulence surface antigen [Stigmatella aurantiaca]|uniref:Virulence surface antigen n=1 Tax=Stigmatella aurantiaca TaxID=41 RepID=A0A1H7FG68_STIAU|nr:YopT-type cysteine protease domain-containing protein [Stigmatella aurantiaca]SEK24754.1 virulence surface antigen [Stigmatella aurantiaca]